MPTINKSIFSQTRPLKKVRSSPPLINRYLDYAERQNKLQLLWYLKVIIVIPCVFMVLSIFAMAMITAHYIWFIFLSMLLFFANFIAHITGAKSTFFVPLYHFTIALFILIPLITYILFL